MPTPIQRESVTKGIEERYTTQNAGGAYNAKTAGTATTDVFNNEFADGFTKGGQNTNLPKKESLYVKGLDETRYAPSGRR